jgi:hypothetical protein
VKAAATAVLVAALLAGCGGGGSSSSPAATAPPQSAISTPPPSVPKAPTATTNTPPTHHRTKPQPLDHSSPSEGPLKVGSSYTCGGKPLKTIDARGPITVKPVSVKPGQSFTVTISARNVHIAVVSLAGVSLKPIQSNAKEQNGRLVATLRMPARAGCGNKLIDIEGDITAEAFIGVRD